MASARPNILLITSDQQHWAALGLFNPEIKTPNLDRLAARGMAFTRAYTVNPTCTPTRASIITGNYPSQHGAYSLGTKLMESEHVVGDDLQLEGYRTALVGKAHFQPLAGTNDFPSLEAYPILQNLDFWKKFHGPFYGFEHIELARNHTDEAHIGQHYALWMEEKGLDNWRDYFRTPTGNVDAHGHHWPIPEEYHYDAWIAERTNALMEEYASQDENFFLWASFFDPHPQCMAPAPWDTMYDPDSLTLPEVREGEHEKNPPHFQLTQQQNPDFSAWKGRSGQGIHGMHCQVKDRAWLKKETAVYYGMVSLMDKYIGTILDKLESLGMAENTLVVFTTDHGHFLGQHGLNFKGPFHYEDLVKVPFLVSMPGTVPQGVRSDSLQSLVDLAPTFLNFAGLKVPPSMTGLDQSPVWKGEAPTLRDHVVVENRHEPDTIHVKTYIDERYKLTVYFRHDYGELFDLREDPNEFENLWDSPDHQALKHELTRKLLFAEMGKEPLPMPRIWGA